MSEWWFRASPDARRALVAASLGWMLDAMDVLLYAFVLNDIRREFALSDAASGALVALPLAASAIGGAAFGRFADRAGRTRALIWSILVYSIATALCGFARSPAQLGACRVLVGFGMGGEWATGAALVAETWPDRYRGTAMGVMQSAWAVGYAAAAVLSAMVLPAFGWRAVFFAGVLPALATLWVRRSVREPPVWRSRPAAGSWVEAFRGPTGRTAVVLGAMNAATMFAWWGLFTWIPAFLGRPAAEGGAGLDVIRTSTWIVLMQIGMWCGYVSYGALADRFGRRRTYVTYLLVAAVLVPVYGVTRNQTVLLVLGPVVAFFGTGYFSGFGVVSAELFPTAIRATAQGLTYNAGRLLSALAPLTIGGVSQWWGLGSAFTITSAAFIAAAICWRWIPETRGRGLMSYEL